MQKPLSAPLDVTLKPSKVQEPETQEIPAARQPEDLLRLARAT